MAHSFPSKCYELVGIFLLQVFRTYSDPSTGSATGDELFHWLTLPTNSSYAVSKDVT